MIVAAAQGEAVLGPDDLGSHLEAGGFEQLLDLAHIAPGSIPTADIASDLFLVVAAREIVHAHSNTREASSKFRTRA